MANQRVSDAEILAQIPAAKDREEGERRAGLRATQARFDAGARRVVLELTNGYGFAFPVRAIRALGRASNEELARVELDASGGVLQWESLDVDLSVPGLLLSAIGEDERRRHFARLIGKSRSASKAEAARRNGLRGGRPRLYARDDKGKTFLQTGARPFSAANKGRLVTAGSKKKPKSDPGRRSKR